MKLEKIEGKTANCPTCQTLMFCVKKPAQGNYPEKLQWQNKDGRHHYNYDYETGEITCNIPDPNNPSQQNVGSSSLPATGSVTPPVKTLDVVDLAANAMIKTMDVNIKIIHLAEQRVLEFLKSKGDANPNPAKVGLFLKLLLDMEKGN